MQEVTTLVFTLEELNELIDGRIKEALEKHTGTSWMSEKEAQAYTGFSHYTLHNARAEGYLKATKINRLVRYHRDDLDAWLRSKLE